MIPDTILLPRTDVPARLSIVSAASALGTVFYTPGGAAGWALDLFLRSYLAFTRRAAAARRQSGARHLPMVVPTVSDHDS
jgi:hypothetical protein